MRNCIKSTVFAAVFAIAAFGGASAGSASLGFGDARWLWPAELGVATNTVVEFRQTFAAGRASSARMAIAAATPIAANPIPAMNR